jgi:hypothetical protein
MLSQALVNDALWGLGWDVPEIVDIGRRIQRNLGFSRITFFPARLTESYSLLADIDQRLGNKLPGSIVFYQAAGNHVGFINELEEIPWKGLVFETHQDERCYSSILGIMKDRCGAIMVQQRNLLDGDNLPRQLLLFVR